MEEKKEENELVMTINITLDDMIQSHKSLFESYTRLPNPQKENALFFFQEILEQMREDEKVKDLMDSIYAMQEEKLKKYYKEAN